MSHFGMWCSAMVSPSQHTVHVKTNSKKDPRFQITLSVIGVRTDIRLTNKDMRESKSFRPYDHRQNVVKGTPLQTIGKQSKEAKSPKR